MEQSIVSAKKIIIENERKYGGIVLLRYKIEYPRFEAPIYRMSVAVINEYYKNRAIEFQDYCETVLFDIAVRQYLEDIQNDYPIRTLEAVLTYEITYMASCIISLYCDQYEYTGGAHGNTARDSQTWSLQKCGLIELRRLVKCPPGYKAYILREVEKQIRNEPEVYFENYKELVREAFNEYSYYCIPEEIVIYYQQYDIAPYSSGIREFGIPYSDCVVDPVSICFKIKTL